ncbi:F-box domain-containing protein [Favolaschia claudopus]|uniref:F-box domain-containing protein n=1 Tax=Favolaschia claudopus TaxID=2862362 RepID=A0AAW0AMG7_9AGAR
MLESMKADRALIAEKEAKIIDLETRISILRKSITIAQLEKQVVLARLDSYKYPVLTLPNEIVSEIFVHFIPPYPNPPPPSGVLSPTTLTHICRHWREIALTTPALWRSINAADRFGRHTPQELAALATLWLDRSAGCRVSISATEPSPIFAALISHRSRLEHLELDAIRTWPLEVLEGPMPRLRNLLLRTPFLLPHISSTPITIQDVPLLRTLTLPISTAAPHPILPWAQLTSLTFGEVHPNDCGVILQKTPDLLNLSCFLSLRQDLPTQSIPATDIPLLRLKSLVLETDRAPEENFFQSFLVPALESLEVQEDIMAGPDSDRDAIDSLDAFIANSDCKLKTLRITEASMPWSSYRKVFPSIPEIVLDEHLFG